MVGAHERRAWLHYCIIALLRLFRNPLNALDWNGIQRLEAVPPDIDCAEAAIHDRAAPRQPVHLRARMPVHQRVGEPVSQLDPITAPETVGCA